MNHEGPADSPPDSTPLLPEPAKSDFLSETIAGLSRRPPTLPCKYFYDERGATLFQKICDLPEYYITRTETAILRLYAHEMALCIGPRSELIGLGTGAGTKTRILLEELEAPAVYIPIDISNKQLRQSTALFRRLFPGLEILPVCADYLEPLALPAPRRNACTQSRLLSRINHRQLRTGGSYQILAAHCRSLRKKRCALDRRRFTERSTCSRGRIQRPRRRDRTVQRKFTRSGKPRDRREF